MHELLNRLFAWWLDPRSHPEDFFVENLHYDVGIPRVEAGEFLWQVRQALPPRDVTVLGRVVEANQGVLVFESVDPVTLLRHRTSWLVEARDEKIVSIIETNAIIASRTT